MIYGKKRSNNPAMQLTAATDVHGVCVHPTSFLIVCEMCVIPTYFATNKTCMVFSIGCVYVYMIYRYIVYGIWDMGIGYRV